MTNKTKGINAVHTQVMLIRLNRIMSSIRTLGNYKQVIGKQTDRPMIVPNTIKSAKHRQCCPQCEKSF